MLFVHQDPKMCTIITVYEIVKYLDMSLSSPDDSRPRDRIASMRHSQKLNFSDIAYNTKSTLL